MAGRKVTSESCPWGPAHRGQFLVIFSPQYYLACHTPTRYSAPNAPAAPASVTFAGIMKRSLNAPASIGNGTVKRAPRNGASTFIRKRADSDERRKDASPDKLERPLSPRWCLSRRTFPETLWLRLTGVREIPRKMIRVRHVLRIRILRIGVRRDYLAARRLVFH